MTGLRRDYTIRLTDACRECGSTMVVQAVTMARRDTPGPTPRAGIQTAMVACTGCDFAYELTAAERARFTRTQMLSTDALRTTK